MKTMYGIGYTEPNVYVLQKGSLGVAEYAARTAYDSFEASEHSEVLTLNRAISSDTSSTQVEKRIKDLNSIESSELLDKLVWAYHHECYSEDTECLTSTGWKMIKSVTKNDEVITLNPDTKKVEKHKPTNLFEYDYTGKMIHFESKHIDLLVSPNHKVYISDIRKQKNRSSKNRTFSLLEAKSVIDIPHCHTCESKGTSNRKQSLSNDLLKFIGFFIGDGILFLEKYAVFHLKKQRKIDFLENLCKSTEGLEFSRGYKDNNSYTIKVNDNIIKILKECYTEKEKTIPLSIINSETKEGLNALLEGLTNADGDYNLFCQQGIMEISTTSEAILERISMLAVYIGKGVSNVSTTLPKDTLWPSGKTTKKENKKAVHCIRILNSKLDRRFNNSEKESKVAEIPYSGKIYCVEVHNHILMVRRNKKMIWSGNSVVEHVNISFLVQNISRGVLQELARHRIASYTVRSTRYTMQNLLHAFNVAQLFTLESIETFKQLVKNIDLLTVTEEAESLEILSIYHKLNQQQKALGLDTFLDLSVSKDARKIYGRYAYSDEMFIDAKELYNELTKSKAKRNVGDPFKWIVTDNWSVDLVMTFNLRSLKNFIKLRDSNAAFFQIQWLANEVKKSLPKEYLKLIKKENK